MNRIRERRVGNDMFVSGLHLFGSVFRAINLNRGLT
jgi:hypothetical protein